jgi:ketosteroid isomerase-like protein
MRTLVAVGSLVLTVASLHAAEPGLHGPVAAARAIAKADGDFATLAKREGAAKAFRDSMDAVDGVIYGGGSEPAIGSDAIYKKMGGDAPDESTLEWHPVEAFAAKSGDMGVTRGRWTATSKADATKAASGSYVTVWRKNAKGEWKGLIDIGAADKPKQ